MQEQMRVKSWQCVGCADYQGRLVPLVHQTLAALGGNSAYAEYAIAEAVRRLAGSKTVAISIRFYIVSGDLRVVLRAEEGIFPVHELQHQIHIVRRTFHSLSWQKWMEKTGGCKLLSILTPVQNACFSLNGKKIVLFFRYPFSKNALSYSLGELLEKLFWEKEDVIFQDGRKS